MTMFGVGLARLYSWITSSITFDPDNDIPSLAGKVVFITGGALYYQLYSFDCSLALIFALHP